MTKTTVAAAAQAGRTGIGLGICALALAVGGVVPRDAAAQSRPAPTVAESQARPSVAMKADPVTAGQKNEGRTAATRLCRDIAAYTSASRSAGAVNSTQVLFASVQPLCSVEGGPVRMQKFDCSSKTGAIHGNCATHWWETLLDGLSWCGDMQFMCIAMGGTWESR